MHLEERRAARIDRQLDAADDAEEAELARFLASPDGPIELP
jgi:hypothetical protein